VDLFQDVKKMNHNEIIKNEIRFFLDVDIIDRNCIQFPEYVIHQIINVLKKKVGDTVFIFNGKFKEYKIILDTVSKIEVKGHIEEEYNYNGELDVNITLYQSLVEPSRMEMIIQKCTELGVKSIIPVISEKCKFKSISTNKFKRWKNIVRESSEQSFRSVLLDIKEIINFKDACLQSEGLRIFCNEFEIKNNINLISKTDLQNDCRRNISIFVGPVSGYSDDEIAWAKKCDLKSVSLGKRILRTETAAIVSVANVINQLT